MSNYKDLTFENKLWKAADKLRKKVEVHEYKYIVLGLFFLRYISFAFEEVREQLKKEYKSNPNLEKILEDKDYYLSEGVLYVPEKARWDYIKSNANVNNIGEIIDNAIEILEKEYPKQLGDVIP
ncbi:MAG: type I restriction-modification system subunit M N-terminal domain-containing protein, partial [Candidatus Hydrogenedens sp.]